MIIHCPRCGAELLSRFRGAAFETEQKCAECGVAAAEPPAMLAPSDAEVTYGLDEWPVVDRAALTAALTADDIPYRWEPGVVLVVPEPVEAVVDGILDDLEGSAEVGDGDGGGGSGREPGATDDDDEADGGEEAQAVMSDLFLAADRIHRAPSDPDLADELAAVADLVGASLPPYGVEASTWRQMHDLAVAVGEADDEDATAESAAALRDFLRPYV